MKIRKIPPKSQSRNPSGRPKSQEKRDVMLNTAEDFFLKLGFELTSMDAVSKAAGVSKLTIYSHFADKDALFKAVIERKCLLHQHIADFSTMADMPVKQVLEKIGTGFIQLVTSDEAIRIHRIIEAEAIRHPKVAELFYAAGPTRVKESFRGLLSIWQKQKKLDIPDMDMAIDHFFCLMKGEAHMKMLLNLQTKCSSADIARHVESAVALFLARYMRS